MAKFSVSSFIIFCLLFFAATSHFRQVSAIDDNIGAPDANNATAPDVNGGEQDDCPHSIVISVDEFGAKADGTPDNEAFEKAWEEACSSDEGVAVVVPEQKTYRLKPIRFNGPCKSSISIEIYGTIEASDDPSDYDQDLKHWIVFDKVENLLVEGGGTLKGNGKIWWDNSCKKNKDKALTFNENKNLVVNDLKIQDSQKMHLSFDSCENVQAYNLVVTAPEDSPNTDGIHITGTKNILVADTTVGTGDDCVSIVSGSENVQIRNIVCGPGHGISIGSLGKGNSEAHVSKVIVDGATISETTNGLRIKTWQGGSGSAEDIIFQNVQMNDVKNPIIIDQNYCDQDSPCEEQDSAVQVKNVAYKNIFGTSKTKVAIMFDCSKSHPCEGITMENVKLDGQGNEAATATCNNVQATTLGDVSPACQQSNNFMSWFLGKLYGDNKH
ncbi:Glycoside hydrolase, family 28 [Corchorus capsularis]|uniref:endo-polygalacturonase n=1 Tax=Corchorus capsularis TaxID=210143 RepID=A0A1R3KEJ4_COCAP|nr:Glycoside hydrolase, family 28 [Corchorus capsularis]